MQPKQFMLHYPDQCAAFFADAATALPAVLVVSMWSSFPFFTLFYLAALQGIPDELYESASVDGANLWLQFRHITLPLLMPIIVATVVLRVIGLVNAPDLLIVLTGGGPGHATQVLSLYAFQKAYAEFDFGYAAALSVVMLLLLMAFTVVYDAIAEWNRTREPKYRGAFAMNSPVRSGQFEWASSERVQEAIAAGMAGLD